MTAVETQTNIGSASAKKEKGLPLQVNLISCPRWDDVIQTGRHEYMYRYKVDIPSVQLVEQALAFCKPMTGDQVYESVFDAYDFGKIRKGAVRVTEETYHQLTALTERMINTSTIHEGKVRWTNRYVICAALYLYCNHLIKFKDKEILLPSNSMLYQAN